jgi:hypothetical protein
MLIYSLSSGIDFSMHSGRLVICMSVSRLPFDELISTLKVTDRNLPSQARYISPVDIATVSSARYRYFVPFL